MWPMRRSLITSKLDITGLHSAVLQEACCSLERPPVVLTLIHLVKKPLRAPVKSLLGEYVHALAPACLPPTLKVFRQPSHRLLTKGDHCRFVPRQRKRPTKFFKIRNAECKERV